MKIQENTRKKYSQCVWLTQDMHPKFILKKNPTSKTKHQEQSRQKTQKGISRMPLNT